MVDSIGLVYSKSVADSVDLASSVSVVNWFDVVVVDIVVVIGISGVDNVTPSGTIGIAISGNRIQLYLNVYKTTIILLFTKKSIYRNYLTTYLHRLKFEIWRLDMFEN